jgi:hypothetical protein
MRSAPWGHVYPQGHFTGLLRYCRTIPGYRSSVATISYRVRF